MATVQDIPDVNAENQTKTILPPDVLLERNIRRYIKPQGGFRKDLPDCDVEIGLELLKKLGRNATDGWDYAIVVPGFEHIVATPPKAKPQALLEQTIMRQQKQIDELLADNKKSKKK